MNASAVAPRGFFVTGTDTGVGKTLVACLLLHHFSAQGVRAIGMKPVASGATLRADQLVNDDVLALEAASNVSASRELTNPYCFEPAIAPHIAAHAAGVTISLTRLRSAYQELARIADCVVVEGAGGFRVPLGPRFDMADLAIALRLPVILVVGLRLGCINHALLSAHAVRSCNLHIAGWIGNHIDPNMVCAEENVSAIAERIGAPMMARVPFFAVPDATSIVREISFERLCASASS
jgi:dethiobiotin synthetase